MSAPPSTRGATIANKSQLVEYIAEGSKPEAAWRIGTEHEKFVFRLADHRPVGYDGPQGIRALLEGMQRFGWEAVYENESAAFYFWRGKGRAEAGDFDGAVEDWARARRRG